MGRIEIARGTEDGVEWLLQTGNGQAGHVDPCLRLSTYRRACAPQNGTTVEWAGPGEGDDLPPFAIVATERQAAVARVVAMDGEVLGESVLHPVGDGPGRAAVIFAGVNMFGCADPAELSVEFPDAYVVARVDLLNESGAVIGCHGEP